MTNQHKDGKDVIKIEEGVYISKAEFNSAVKRIEYQEEYNKRPEVIERRKEYMKKRNAKLAVAKKLFRQAQTDPELAVKLGMGTRVEM